MNALWVLTVKNIKLLLRSRSSALIIIFAPLLIILLLGLSYNNSAKFGLKIGVYSPAITDDVKSFIVLLEEEEFTITRYENDLNRCIGDIKQSKIHTCISLPENLQVESNQQKVLTFYVDPSRVNLVWMIQETVKSKFNLKSQEVSEQLTNDLISRLLETKETVISEQQRLATIKDKTTSAVSTATSADQNLGDSGLLTSNNDTAAIISGVETILIDTKDVINDAINAVNSAGIQDDNERSQIKSYLNEAIGNIQSIGSSNGTGPLGMLQIKLNSAVGVLDATAKSLDSIQASLQEAGNSLDSLEQSLAGIQSNIEKQKVTEAETVASPFVTKVEPVSEQGTYLNYLFPALLVLIVMFSSMLLGTTLVMIEKNSPAFLRNFFLPVRKVNFIVSIYLTNVILTLVEILVILGISLFFLEEILSVLPLVALVLFIVSSVFTFLGMAIGYIFTSEETGVLASISLGSILLFTSGVLLPLEGVSLWLRDVLAYNPFILAEKMVRGLFIFDSPLRSMIPEFVTLIGYVVILFLIIWLVESLLHKQLSQRFLRKHHNIAKKRKLFKIES